MNFCLHVLGVEELREVTSSKRCLGAAKVDNPTDRCQASPLKVSEQGAAIPVKDSDRTLQTADVSRDFQGVIEWKVKSEVKSQNKKSNQK